MRDLQVLQVLQRECILGQQILQSNLQGHRASPSLFFRCTMWIKCKTMFLSCVKEFVYPQRCEQVTLGSAAHLLCFSPLLCLSCPHSQPRQEDVDFAVSSLWFNDRKQKRVNL